MLVNDPRGKNAEREIRKFDAALKAGSKQSQAAWLTPRPPGAGTV
jgi:hypothetical protein